MEKVENRSRTARMQNDSIGAAASRLCYQVIALRSPWTRSRAGKASRGKSAEETVLFACRCSATVLETLSRLGALFPSKIRRR
jgi:hypothetical protein